MGDHFDVFSSVFQRHLDNALKMKTIRVQNLFRIVRPHR